MTIGTIDEYLYPTPNRTVEPAKERTLPIGRRLRRRRAWNFDDQYRKEVNLYGCTPCPRCGSRCRAVFVGDKDRVRCYECDYRERVRRRGER